MPRKLQVSVEPRPDGRWAVQTDGTQRADSLHTTENPTPSPALANWLATSEPSSP
jgi:hypothetical protein